MSELLKLKLTPDWDKFEVGELYRVDVEYIDKNVSSSCLCVADKWDKNNFYRLFANEYTIELTSFYDCPNDADSDCEKTLIKSLDYKYSYLYADDLEEVVKALEMLKPEMEKRLEEMHNIKLEDEKRKDSWLKKESVEITI